MGPKLRGHTTTSVKKVKKISQKANDPPSDEEAPDEEAPDEEAPVQISSRKTLTVRRFPLNLPGRTTKRLSWHDSVLLEPSSHQ